MSPMTKTRIGVGAFFALLIGGTLVPDSAPTWLRYSIAGTEFALVAAAVVAWLVLFTMDLKVTRTRPKPIDGSGERSTENRIQVLGGGDQR